MKIHDLIFVDLSPIKGGDKSPQTILWGISHLRVTLSSATLDDALVVVEDLRKKYPSLIAGIILH